MFKFVNCTPHALTVVGLGVLPASGMVARVATVREAQPGFLMQASPCEFRVRLVRQAFGQVEGLPAPAPDTVYVVSGMVLSALAGSRLDAVAPDTGADAVRENGQIVAVRGFVC
jgi:hypothetical protein